MSDDVTRICDGCQEEFKRADNCGVYFYGDAEYCSMVCMEEAWDYDEDQRLNFRSE